MIPCEILNLRNLISPTKFRLSIVESKFWILWLSSELQKINWINYKVEEELLLMSVFLLEKQQQNVIKLYSWLYVSIDAIHLSERNAPIEFQNMGIAWTNFIHSTRLFADCLLLAALVETRYLLCHNNKSGNPDTWCPFIKMVTKPCWKSQCQYPCFCLNMSVKNIRILQIVFCCVLMYMINRTSNSSVSSKPDIRINLMGPPSGWSSIWSYFDKYYKLLLYHQPKYLVGMQWQECQYKFSFSSDVQRVEIVMLVSTAVKNRVSKLASFSSDSSSRNSKFCLSLREKFV